MCTAIFNGSRLTLITGNLQKNDQENIVKHGFQIPLDMPQTENSNQVSLPVAGDMVYSNMQSIKSLSAISYKT